MSLTSFERFFDRIAPAAVLIMGFSTAFAFAVIGG